jgi:portal protein
VPAPVRLPIMTLGGRVRAFFGMSPRRTFDEPRRTAQFSAVYPVDQLVLWAEARTGRVDREKALGVPAVLRGRNMICSIATLPLEAVDADNRLVDHPLLAQVDANVPNVVTLAMTLEDLLFESVAWWRITGFGWDGMPSSAVRYAPDQVSMTPPPTYRHGYLPSGLPTEPSTDAAVGLGKVVWMGGEPVPFDQVIRFDSPNPPLLTAGQRAIRRACALDLAAELYAKHPQPMAYFTPTEGADPAGDDDIATMLEDFEAAVREHSTVYVPAALTYNEVQQPTPADLQLVSLQQRASLDLANALGIDPEDLGISTTSRTYQSAVDRRRDRINDVLAMYMRAITDRLRMPDVTAPDVRVRFLLDDYLKADPKTRAEVQQIYANMGATDAAEVREDEGRPPRQITPPAAAPQSRPIQATVGAPVRQLTASDHTPITFSRQDVTFECDAVCESFSVDMERRVITGLVIPWGEQSGFKNGRRYRFARGGQRFGKIDRVKYLEDHQWSLAFGKATKLDDQQMGLVATFKVARGDHGDKMLALGADGVKDGLSPGVDWEPADEVPDPLFPGGRLVLKYTLREVSQLANPSFENSRLISVTANDQEGSSMNCSHCGVEITAGVAHTCEPTPAVAAPAVAAPAAAAPVTFTAEQVRAMFGQLNTPPPFAAPDGPAPRPTVDPTTVVPARTAVTLVDEPVPYQFSYEGGRHIFRTDAQYDFSTDLMALLKAKETGQDATAQILRVNSMIGARFANVDRADTTDITQPHQYRPDMWQPQMDYITPLWDMVAAGSTDGTKFDIPEFNSSSGLVGPATEETEPAAGTFTVKLQTITPTQVWGKVEITRQAWRAGGNPQLSGILWDQMLREYYEDREAAVATFLATLTAATDITLTGRPAATPDNDDDQVTVGDFSAAQTDLQFVRGGNRFSAFAVHQDLYRLFARVTDDAGRPLFPQISPSNANGTAQSLFKTMNVGGTTLVPSWALGAGGQTTATNSWLFDPAKVRGWASAPERLFWDFGATVQTANIPQLSFVTVGIYGDVAFGNTDIAGVRQVIFDPSV